jgi:hypothetical protein
LLTRGHQTKLDHIGDIRAADRLENYFLPGDLEAQISAFVDDL